MDFIRLYIKPNDTKFYESKINLDGDAGVDLFFPNMVRVPKLPNMVRVPKLAKYGNRIIDCQIWHNVHMVRLGCMHCYAGSCIMWTGGSTVCLVIVISIILRVATCVATFIGRRNAASRKIGPRYL